MSSPSSSIHAPNVFRRCRRRHRRYLNATRCSGAVPHHVTANAEARNERIDRMINNNGNAIRRPTRTHVTRPKTRGFPSCKVTITLHGPIHIYILYSNGRHQTRWPNSISNDVPAIRFARIDTVPEIR